jgi:hypothetical protein
MLSSSALLFLSFAQAKIQSFQILGISASFGRPEAVVYGLAALTLYFTYRYALYLMQEPEERLKPEFFTRLNRYAKSKIIDLRDHQFPSGKGLEIIEAIGARKANRFSWVIQVGCEKDGMGGTRCCDLIVSLKEIWPEVFKASVLAVIARSYVSDYFFPFVLAVIALLVTFLE